MNTGEWSNYGNWAILATGILLIVWSGILFAKSKKRSKSELIDFLQDADHYTEIGRAIGKAIEFGLKETGADAGYLLLTGNRNSTELALVADRSTDPGFIAPTLLSIGDGISGRAFNGKQPLLVRSKKQAEALAQEFAHPPHSVLSIPIEVVDSSSPEGHSVRRPVGVLTFVVTKPKSRLTKNAMSVGAAYSSIVSLLVNNLMMMQFAHETIMDSLQEISHLIEAKDPLSVGHARRTGELALVIAEHMGLDNGIQNDIRNAAALIDLGKVAIPDYILRKDGQLTDEELAVVKEHPLVSYNICNKLRLPESVLMLVRNHHERLDGSGYPDGLKAGELPLPLRVLSIADTFDAMKCNRYHRQGMSNPEIITTLVRESGTKFDPAVVQAVQQLLESGAIDQIYSGFAEQNGTFLRAA